MVKSDNGPPLNGEKFAQFASALGFKQPKVTPLWPRANGEIEQMYQSCKSRRKELAKRVIQALLHNYRTTRQATTDITPATFLLKRAVRTDSYPVAI